MKEIAPDIDFTDSSCRSLKMIRNDLIVHLNSWDYKILKITFLNTIEFLFRIGSIPIGVYEKYDECLCLNEAISLRILDQSIKNRKINSGRKKKLSLENALLMTLEYIREYRTYFHVSQSYGISESSTYKRVKWVEDILIKHPDFALPGRKALLKNDI